MSDQIRLQGFNPEDAEHIRSGDCEFIITCWNCRKDFTVWIGMSNMHCNMFMCPHCDKRNEIE